MSYGIVLFDLDHTLFDSDASMMGAYESTMRSVGVDDPSSIYADFDRINQALWRRVEQHELSPNDVRVLRFQQLLDDLTLDGDAETMAEEFVAGLIAHGELYPGASDLLDVVAGRARLALVTNGIGRVQRGRLERLGLGGYFETVTISGEVGTNKPGPEIFNLTFDAMNIVDRTSSVMIGDNLGSDILGGRQAGIDTIWFNPQGRSVSDVEPTHSVADLESIIALV